jgi:hypothetical protein
MNVIGHDHSAMKPVPKSVIMNAAGECNVTLVLVQIPAIESAECHKVGLSGPL